MFVLGLLLMILAGAAAAGFLISNYGGDAFSVSLFGQNIDNVHRATLYIAGIVTGVVFLLGLRLITAAIARGRRRRLERKRIVQENRGTTAELKAENERLAKKLEDEKRARQSTRAEVYPTDSGTGSGATTGRTGKHAGAEHGSESDHADHTDHADGGSEKESEGRRGLFRR
ncbi:MAG: hypothetical protein M3Z02_03930 [Actinomycetota bacterium]|nr:hypothetical protein [Actinomycetota bacterium]